MAQPQETWPGAAVPPPAWLPPGPPRQADLTPMGPVRPRYREPYAIGGASVLAGLGAGLLWFVPFGAIGHDLVSYAWWTLSASVAAWSAALVLAWLGDRGVASGVAASAGLAWSVGTAFVVARWIATGDWPMW
jgi:hypothetical protein